MKKWKVILSILIPIIAAVSVIGFIAISHGETVEQELIAKLLLENEDNPESGKYLVTDEYVSRVSPETTVKDFKNNFTKGEEVKVYEDKTCLKEVKDGYVYSGMYAKYENNGKVLQISVFGDISSQGKNSVRGDGKYNQVELTRQIRHYVETDGWKIENAEEKQSADVTCDKNIDDKDIKSSIKYIVYNELAIPSVKEVKVPEVKVAEGKLIDEEKYADKVRLTVKQINKDDESKKTIYKITGDKTTEYVEIDGTEKEITLEGEGIYKVTAYTYGTLDNKSKAGTQIIKIQNGIQAYKVEHYKETLEDGKYELVETENLTGNVETEVKAVARKYEGFSYSQTNENNVSSGILKANEELTLKLYYTRNAYKLSLDKNENVDTVTGAGTYKYGQTVEIDATLKEDVGEGYIAKWDSWKRVVNVKNTNEQTGTDAKEQTNKKTSTNTEEEKDNKEQQIDNKEDAEASNTVKEVTALKDKHVKFIMPAAGVSLKAVATKEISQYDYEVNFYFDGEKNEELSYTGNVDYGTVINKELPEVAEYEITKKENYPMTIGVNKNEANIYYEIVNYKIQYNLDEGSLPQNEENRTEYNSKTQDFTLINPSKDGYTFEGWIGSNGLLPKKVITIEKGTTGDKEYTANWKPLTDTKYTVVHYLENLDGTYKKQAEDVLGGETDSVVTAVPNQYTGFTYDEEKSKDTKSGKITADGKLVLELYYSRNSYELTLIKGENIKEVRINEEANNPRENNIVKTFKYQEEVTISAEIFEAEGYTITWDGWKSIDETVMENKGNIEETIEIPASNVTLTAKAVDSINEYKYTVKYYKNNQKFDEKELSANYGSVITTYQEKTLLGYELDEEKTGDINLVVGINEEENIINVYYKSIQYNIVYRNTNNTVISSQNPSTYDVETESFTLVNPEKYGYNFLGWTGGVVDEEGNIDNEASTGTTGNFLEATTNAIIAKGSIGNRIYTANFEPKSGIKYSIEHYTEKLDGTYEIYSTISDLVGKTDDEVTASPITIEGFTYDEEKSKDTISGKIKPDGSLVLKVYYSRNSYTLKLHTSEFTSKVSAGEYGAAQTLQKTFKFEEEIAISAELKNVTGYTVTFTKWESANENLGNLANRESSFVMPAGDVELTAIGEKRVNQYSYYIKYFYNNVEDEDKAIEGKDDYGKVIDTYPNKRIIGYELDEEKTGEVSLTIGVNEEENVIKIYYKPTVYTITYDYAEGSLTESTSNPSEYTILSENIVLNNPTRRGYVFKGWTGGVVNSEGELDDEYGYGTTPRVNVPTTTLTIATGSIGNRKYTANWEEDEFNYIIDYYYEQDSRYVKDASKTETHKAKFNQVISTYTDNVKTGYELKEEPEPITITDNEAENVMRVYYNKKTYTLTLEKSANVTSVTGAGTYKYGTTVEIDAELETEFGYDITFDKWESNNTYLMANQEEKNVTFEMPAGNLTLTARATKEGRETNYNVEYYYQENGEYPSVPKDGDTVERTGTTGATVSITTADKVAILPGYTYDENASGKIESQEVKPDGSTVLKVYFKQQFTVTYKPGEYGAFEETIITGVDYGADVPDYTGSKEGTDGYTFDKWTPEKADRVTENLVYTAEWKQMSIPTITHTPTDWTNQDVTVKIEAPEGYENYEIQYSVKDSSVWTKYEGEFTVGENCILEARLKEGRNRGEKVEHEIANIDKEAPEIASVTVNVDEEDIATATVNGTDNLSGIVEYGIKKSTSDEYEVETCENALEKEIVFEDIYENGTYDIYLKDAAGNKTDTTITVNNIDPYMVAKIVAAPEGYETLVGKEYEKLSLALSDSDAAAQVGNVKIQIIHSVLNESNTIQSGRDYTIDLNNYKIRKRTTGSVLEVSGKLTVVEGNEEGTGRITNPVGAGVYIKLGGEFTLGEDTGGVPNQTAPQIDGKTYGVEKAINKNAEKIYNEDDEKEYYPEGVFNFYDGKIIGEMGAMQLQKVNDTPLLYDPTVKTNEETGEKEATLKIVSGIEAVIGKKRYMLLEDAVEAANNKIGNKNTQVEIQVVKDISKDADHKVIMDNTKNIKLDLNGHVITTVASDYVLTNYGKLEIYDSTEAKTGTVTSSTANTILNASSTAEENAEYTEVALNNVTNNGTYYFESRAEGGLISNNAGVGNSTANSYMEIDLTQLSGIYEFVVDTSISSQSGADYGYVTVRNSTNAPAYDSTYGRKIFTSGTEDKEYKFNLVAGEKYYIHFGYRKDGNTNTDSDCFIIKNIKMAQNNVTGSLTITSGTIQNTKESANAIVNHSKLVVNGGTIKTTQNSTHGINNKGYAELNGGTFTAYYQNVLNLENGVVNVKGGTYTSSNVTCFAQWTGSGIMHFLGEGVSVSGYDCGIYNESDAVVTVHKGSIAGVNNGIKNNVSTGYITVDGGSISSSNNYGIYNSNGSSTNYYSLIVKNIAVYGKNYAIYNTSGKIKIDNVDISSQAYGIYGAGGIIEIENANIKSASTGINNSGSGTIIIQNIDMSFTNSSGTPNVKYGLIMYGGKLTLNNGKILSQRTAINVSYSTVEVKNGTIRTAQYEDTVVVGNSGTYKMTGGSVSGVNNAIQNNGTAIIEGGSVEAPTSKYAIYSPNYGNTVIGINDEEVKTNSPTIKGGGIVDYLGTLSFYDGVLIGPVNNVIQGMLNNVPEGYELVKEVKEDNLQYITLGIPTEYVAKIQETDNPDLTDIDERLYKLEEDGYYYFVTLNSAVVACNTENTTTIDLLTSPWIYKTITVDVGQDITVKLNDHTTYLMTNVDFDNNGTIRLINDIKEENNVRASFTAKGGMIVKNNTSGKFTMNNVSISYNSNQGSSGSCKKIIDNYGEFNLENATYNIGNYTNSGYTTYTYNIYNESTGTLNTNNVSIGGSSYYSIYNLGVDKQDGDDTIYSVTMKKTAIANGISYNSGKPLGVYNERTGTMLIDDGSRIDTGYQGPTAINNTSTGHVIINSSTIYGAVENPSTGKITVNNSTVSRSYGNTTLYNTSSGTITIKGSDTSIKGMSNRGTATMEAGTIWASGSDPTVDNYGTFTLTGGNINSTNTSYAVSSIRNSGTLNITSDNVNITSARTGITNTGTATILGGTIKATGTASDNYGISNSGTLTIGTRDQNVIYSPKVYGTQAGVYNSKNFYFYDGILEGKTGASISGTVPLEVEEDCMRVTYKGELTFDDKTEEGYSIAEGREISVVEKVYIAYIESTMEQYTKLSKALEDTQDTDKIVLVHDVSISGTTESLEIPEGKNITLDLNGFNIAAGNNETIINNGTLRITDLSGNETKGKFSNGSTTLLSNYGTATLDTASFELSLGGTSSVWSRVVYNNGTLTIPSGSYTAKGSYSTVLINAQAGSTTVTGGTFTATASSTYCYGIRSFGGNMTIENATVSGGTHSIRNQIDGTIDIVGGTRSGLVYNEAAGTINIYSGTTNGEVYNNAGGTINIYDGRINNQVSNNGSGIINISGGTVVASNNQYPVINKSGTTNITGGTFTGNNYGVTSQGGTINIDGTEKDSETPIKITGTNIDSYSNGAITSWGGAVNIKGYVEISSNTTGIYQSQWPGTINIGDKNNIRNSVKITASQTGIYNYNTYTSNVNYYGGTITAPTAVNCYLKAVPDGYNIVRSVNESNQEVYEIGIEDDVVSVGENTYSSINDAIENNDTGTMVLLKDIAMVDSQKITIPEEKDLILDLNSHVLKVHNWDYAIENVGKLKITDESENKTGVIYAYDGNMIKNTGTFEFAGGKLNTYPLADTGNKQRWDYGSRVIYNTGNGITKISGGTIYSYARGDDYKKRIIIYCDNANKIEVTGGILQLYGQGGSRYQSHSAAVYSPNSNLNVEFSGGTVQWLNGGDTYTVYSSGGTISCSGDFTTNTKYGIYLGSGASAINISGNAYLNNGTQSINCYTGQLNISGGTVRAIGGSSAGNLTATGGNLVGTISSVNSDIYEGANVNVSGTAFSGGTNVRLHENAVVKSTGCAITGAANVKIDNATVTGYIENPTTSLNMTGGSITGTSYGIKVTNSNAKVNILDGEITATGGPGIWLTAGTLTLGENPEGDLYPNQEKPSVTGSTYGVQNAGGTVNFYDGVLKGNTYATSGTITNTPELYKVIYSQEGKQANVGIEATFEQVAMVNGNYYDDLASAISAAAGINGTVELYKNINVLNEIQIPQNANVTIDLLGFAISGYVESGAVFNNKGTLTILDSTDDGTNANGVVSYTGTAIMNTGTINVGINDETEYTNAPIIKGVGEAVDGSGTVNVYDGKLEIAE